MLFKYQFEFWIKSHPEIDHYSRSTCYDGHSKVLFKRQCEKWDRSINIMNSHSESQTFSRQTLSKFYYLSVEKNFLLKGRNMMLSQNLQNCMARPRLYMIFQKWKNTEKNLVAKKIYVGRSNVRHIIQRWNISQISINFWISYS